MSKKWSPSAKYCASILHIVASLAIMEQVRIQEWSLPLASIIIVIVTAIKEFWADMTWLEHDSLNGSILDFCCYNWGLVLFWFSTWLLWLAIGMLIVTILIAVLWDIKEQGVGIYDK